MKKLLKLTYITFVMFILLNLISASPVFAFGNIGNSVKTPFEATVLKTALTFAQILVAGYFTIKFSLTGIQYFTAQAATDKAQLKNKITWTLVWGVSAMLAMYLFAYAVGV